MPGGSSFVLKISIRIFEDSSNLEYLTERVLTGAIDNETKMITLVELLELLFRLKPSLQLSESILKAAVRQSPLEAIKVPRQRIQGLHVLSSVVTGADTDKILPLTSMGRTCTYLEALAVAKYGSARAVLSLLAKGFGSSKEKKAIRAAAVKNMQRRGYVSASTLILVTDWPNEDNWKLMQTWAAVLKQSSRRSVDDVSQACTLKRYLK